MLDLHAGTDAQGVVVTLPDGRTARPGSREADALLSAHLGEALRFAPGSDGGRAQAWGRHHDDAPVHVVTDAALAALAPDAEDASAAVEAEALDARRLRANLVLRTPDGTPAGHPEAAWTGRRLRVGQAVLRVLAPTERCVMTTRPQADEVVADRRVLQRIGRRNAACAGVYLEIVRAGEVAEGDPVVALD